MNNLTFEALAYDFSKMMMALMVKYPKAEPEIATVLTDSLGALIAISAKDVPVTLERIAQRLKRFDWKTVKTAHFGEKLGVKDEAEKPARPRLVQVGPPK